MKKNIRRHGSVPILAAVAAHCVVTIVAADPPLTGGPYTIAPITVNSGGGTASAGPYTIISSTGESFAGSMASNDAFINETLNSLDATASTVYFQATRASGQTYQNMIAGYGRPWAPDTTRTPSLSGEPASVLRYLGNSAPTSLRTGFWEVESQDMSVRPFLVAPKLRALKELYTFEMLLGNESFTDAMDPTIGLNGISTAQLGDLFCFQNGSGVFSLLAEELALLRGRALSGSEANWNDDAIYYPSYTTGSGPFRAAIYNRLPPNAISGLDGLAYKSNYAVPDNGTSVSTKYPQGHGDAYGYYLTALRAYLGVLRGTPNESSTGDSEFAHSLIELQDEDTEDVDPGSAGGGDGVAVPYQAVRNMANAMAARSRTAGRIVDLTFRRDYREDPEDPLSSQVLYDSDSSRGWGTADWARRGGIGAYLDWAVVNSLIPVPAAGAGDALGEVHRLSLDEIGQLSAAVSEMQERVDAAGAGLNPLGLVQNVVPFGIDASAIGTSSGPSHYQQVRAAAANAIQSTRNVLEWANQGTQRLREQGEAQNTFDNQIAQSSSDFNNRLIEIFGYPSIDDPADNDFDINTDDLQEGEGPDLLNFMMGEQEVSVEGWTPRSAPGEVQIAISELKIAGLRIEEAEAAVMALEAEIDDLLQFIEFRTQTSAQEIHVIGLATEQNISLTDALKRIKTRCNWWCKFRKGVSTGLGVITNWKTIAGGLGCVASFGSACAVIAAAIIIDAAGNIQDTAEYYKSLSSEFDIQRERERIQGWKEAQLTGIRNAVEIEREKLRLQSLVRQSPQLMVNLAIAGEGAVQALGRVNSSVKRGLRVLEERTRIEQIERDQLEEFRWKDLAFRVFRNNAMQQYGAFFELAARWVFLAGRAFAYEWNDRDFADLVLEDIHRERILGNSTGTSGGLAAILVDLDSADIGNAFNQPFNPGGSTTFSFRRNLLGLYLGASANPSESRIFFVDETTDIFQTFSGGDPTEHGFVTPDAVGVSSSNTLPGGLNSQIEYYVRRLDPTTLTLHQTKTGATNNTQRVNITNPGLGTHNISLSANRRFRAWVESGIVDRLQDLPVMQDMAQLSLLDGRDSGPAIVLRFSTEVTNKNIFGNGPQPPFGGDNFEQSENIKIRSYWLRFDGVNGSAIGVTNPEGKFDLFLFPVGESVLRERNNGPVIGSPRPWAVVDQWLPPHPVISISPSTVQDPDYNPWVATGGDLGGNYINAVKRFTESSGQIELGQPIQSRVDLAGRAAWNTQWLLVIPGGQFDDTTDAAKRAMLMKFIYGSAGNPQDNDGITDIRWTIEAYKN